MFAYLYPPPFFCCFFFLQMHLFVWTATRILVHQCGQPDLWANWHKLSTSDQIHFWSSTAKHLTGKKSVLFLIIISVMVYNKTIVLQPKGPLWPPVMESNWVLQQECSSVNFGLSFSSLVGCNPEIIQSVCDVAASFKSCVNHYYILYYYLYYVSNLKFWQSIS